MAGGVGDGRVGGLRCLRVVGLRCVARAILRTEARVVVLAGANGAGKTTLLEAVYLSARGKTFRGRKAGPLTSLGAAGTRIETEVELSDGARCKMSYRRPDVGEEVAGACLENGSGGSVPVKLVPENAQSLIDGEPQLRRRFLDWNIYQADPCFGKVLADFRRVSAQRNGVLRSRRGGRVLDVWNRAYAEAGEKLARHRGEFIAALDRSFAETGRETAFLRGTTLCYERGWDTGTTLEEAVEARSGEELARGTALVGPTKADFWIGKDGTRATFSRGQTKELVALIQIAAEGVHRASGREPAIFLLDDLEGELDPRAVERLTERLAGTRSQVVVTRIGATAESGPWSALGCTDVFHVEQGAIQIST